MTTRFQTCSLALLLASTSGASAQNSYSIIQEGYNQTVDATQDGIDNANTLSIQQLGASSHDNSVGIHQGGETNVNDAVIQQSGSAVSNSLSIEQIGTGNENMLSFISQHGSENGAELTQTGEGNFNSGSAEQFSYNSLHAEQFGSATTNGFVISQDLNNRALVLQDGTGNNNQANVTQASLDNVEIRQGGANTTNSSEIYMVGGGGAEESFHETFTEQTGDFNKNLSTVQQVGWGNSAYLTQSGTQTQNTSTVFQVGDYYTGNSWAIIDQSGDRTVNISHISSGGIGDHGNLITQGGDDVHNTSDIDQLGHDHRVMLVQDGQGTQNTSEIYQDGEGNQVIITQGGAGVINSSVITQQGTGNTATVTQN